MIDNMGTIKMDRDLMASTIEGTQDPWDILVIGGGATGLGAALDATTRKYRTLLLEKYDFSKGTSSKSTKLVHGGLRYLGQGNYSLVHEALVERDLLLRNAPHLVNDQAFIIPFYSWSGGYYLDFGLKIYDLLSGKLKLMRSRMLKRQEVINQMPGLKTERMKGGILYYDGQFDDSMLAISLAKAIVSQGGTVANYFSVIGLLKENNRVTGVRAVDSETGKEYEIKAKSVINATGVYVDDIIKMDDPENEGMVMPSQGVHVVMDKTSFESEAALVIPKTSDGRVLFAVPWKNKVVIGTTDNKVDKTSIEPVPTQQEVDFILETAERYFKIKPTNSEVKSVFAGLRPLVAKKSLSLKTKDISRRHKIISHDSGFVTITGGKWTTYRKMGEEVVSMAADMAGLEKNKSKTESFNLDFDSYPDQTGEKVRLHSDLDIFEQDIRNAVQFDMARKVEDVLARRSRALLLDAKASREVSSRVAKIMAEELKKDESWINRETTEYKDLADKYIIN